MTVLTKRLQSTVGPVTAPQAWNKMFPTFVLLSLSAILWFTAQPEGLSPQAWHLLVIFVSTIIAIILKPLPIGAISLVATTIAVGTDTLTLSQALTSFSNSVVWLVVFAFFLSHSFKSTGLGTRIAYFFISKLGRSTLGTSYGFVLTELLLAPFIPSTTARGAGIVYPIAISLLQEQGSCPSKGTEDRMGAFLIKVCFQANIVTSAMFMTAMVGNPLAASLAGDLGVEISWSTWAIAALVPGLCNLAILPVVLIKLYPPEIKTSSSAQTLARDKLRGLGSLSRNELIMIATFTLILLLWIFGAHYGIKTTTAALIGLSIMVCSGILKWEDCVRQTAAWETLMWFAPLLMMAGFLTQFGTMTWFSGKVGGIVHDLSWPLTFAILCGVYFYIHYLFASITAHITALFAGFLTVMLAAGTPPLLATMSLIILSNLSGGLTHFGSSPAPVYFGSNYVPVKKWWYGGFILSFVNLAIWTLVGGLWWHFLGYW